MSIESDASIAPESGSAQTSAPSLPKLGRFTHLAVAYAVAVAVLWYIQSATNGIIDPDGYYHIRWSRLLWENLPHGHLPRFTWLPLTILNEQKYVDHHFLF